MIVHDNRSEFLSGQYVWVWTGAFWGCLNSWGYTCWCWSDGPESNEAIMLPSSQLACDARSYMSPYNVAFYDGQWQFLWNAQPYYFVIEYTGSSKHIDDFSFKTSDMNACLTQACHANATCTDLAPPSTTRTCTCNAGYEGDGITACASLSLGTASSR